MFTACDVHSKYRPNEYALFPTSTEMMASGSKASFIAWKMAAELTTKGKKQLADAQKKVKDTNMAFEGLLEMVQANRHYGRLPDLRKPFNLALRGVRKDAKLRPLMLQANAVDRARGFEDAGNKRSALIAWKQVVEKYPNTAAAKIASERIKELDTDTEK